MATGSGQERNEGASYRKECSAEPCVTEEMIQAGLWELDARLPDVVFVRGDDARLVRNVFVAMARKAAQPHKNPR